MATEIEERDCRIRNSFRDNATSLAERVTNTVKPHVYPTLFPAVLNTWVAYSNESYSLSSSLLQVAPVAGLSAIATSVVTQKAFTSIPWVKTCIDQKGTLTANLLDISKMTAAAILASSVCFATVGELKETLEPHAAEQSTTLQPTPPNMG